MNTLKRLDFFRKPQEDLQKDTLSGAILSVLTVFLIIYLSSYALQSPPKVQKQLQVTLPPSQDNNQFLTNLDIIFYHSPCAAITLERRDKTESRTISPNQSGLLFQRIHNNGTSLPENYLDPEIKKSYPQAGEKFWLILTGLKDEERCRITGSFVANKVPGLFSFSHQLADKDLAEIKEIDMESYSKLNFGHKIVSLTFGFPEVQTIIMKKQNAFSESELNRAKGIAFIHDKPLSCSYYVRIVPYIHRDVIYEGVAGETYQYSYHRACFVFFINMTMIIDR